DVEQVVKIVDLQMEEIQARLDGYDLKVFLTPEAKRWLAEKGFDPQFGARPLQRALQRYVESPLSVKILKGEVKTGEQVWAAVDDDEDEDEDALVFSHDEPILDETPAE
ncbi:MAG: hypothetical protein GVY30_10305, partial [Chloroflexi bacterium]|nr:hypothetical protein [Chloroflexota bacterium]